MTFEEILPVVKAGGRARRAARDWHLELVRPSMPDGRPLMPLLVACYPAEGQFLRKFTGGDWDLLADDWELL